MFFFLKFKPVIRVLPGYSVTIPFLKFLIENRFCSVSLFRGAKNEDLLKKNFILTPLLSI